MISATGVLLGVELVAAGADDVCVGALAAGELVAVELLLLLPPQPVSRTATTIGRADAILALFT
ncbi:MAG: hypothetical protein ACR2OB_10190 [Solirubrobacteraceae bacterium]